MSIWYRIRFVNSQGKKIGGMFFFLLCFSNQSIMHYPIHYDQSPSPESADFGETLYEVIVYVRTNIEINLSSWYHCMLCRVWSIRPILQVNVIDPPGVIRLSNGSYLDVFSCRSSSPPPSVSNRSSSAKEKQKNITKLG